MEFDWWQNHYKYKQICKNFAISSYNILHKNFVMFFCSILVIFLPMKMQMQYQDRKYTHTDICATIIKRKSVARCLHTTWISIESFSSAHKLALHLHYVAYTGTKSDLQQIRNIKRIFFKANRSILKHIKTDANLIRRY